MKTEKIYNTIKKIQAEKNLINDETINNLLKELENELIIENNQNKTTINRIKKVQSYLKKAGKVYQNELNKIKIIDDCQVFTDTFTAFVLKNNDIIEGLPAFGKNDSLKIDKIYKFFDKNFINEFEVKYNDIKLCRQKKEFYDIGLGDKKVLDPKKLLNMLDILNLKDCIIAFDERNNIGMVTNKNGSKAIICIAYKH